MQDVREFHADGAAADDHDGLGQIGAENLLFIVTMLSLRVIKAACAPGPVAIRRD